MWRKLEKLNILRSNLSRFYIHLPLIRPSIDDDEVIHQSLEEEWEWSRDSPVVNCDRKCAQKPLDWLFIKWESAIKLMLKLAHISHERLKWWLQVMNRYYYSIGPLADMTIEITLHSRAQHLLHFCFFPGISFFFVHLLTFHCIVVTLPSVDDYL